MKINFSRDMYDSLLAEAIAQDTSIATLITIIIDTHQTYKNSHKGVTNENRTKGGIPDYPCGNSNINKN